jgi:hypothetical protein
MTHPLGNLSVATQLARGGNPALARAAQKLLNAGRALRAAETLGEVTDIHINAVRKATAEWDALKAGAA